MKFNLETRQQRHGRQVISAELSSKVDQCLNQTGHPKVTASATPRSVVSLSRRTYSRFFACIALLGLWLFVGIKGWSAYEAYARHHEMVEQKSVSTIASLKSSYPRLTMVDSAGERGVDIAPQAIVTLKNAPATLKDLKVGDAVKYAPILLFKGTLHRQRC